MILVSRTYWAGMPFWFRRKPEDAAVESLVLRTDDFRQLGGEHRGHTLTAKNGGQGAEEATEPIGVDCRLLERIDAIDELAFDRAPANRFENVLGQLVLQQFGR